MFLKQSKCLFTQLQVAYLGDVVSAKGMEVDQHKITIIMEWPQPQIVKALCGFLGLAGYYRKRIQNYSPISALLTTLLRKNAFVWSNDSTKAIIRLKQAFPLARYLFCQISLGHLWSNVIPLTQILAQFYARRIIHCYYSRVLAKWHLCLPAYEKELMGLVKALQQWTLYLWG